MQIRFGNYALSKPQGREIEAKPLALSQESCQNGLGYRCSLFLTGTIENAIMGKEYPI